MKELNDLAERIIEKECLGGRLSGNATLFVLGDRIRLGWILEKDGKRIPQYQDFKYDGICFDAS